VISVTLPMRLPNPTNKREHWGTKAARTKRQRGAVTLALKTSVYQPDWYGLGILRRKLVVTLTRIAPRRYHLDGHDNLRAAFKACVDAVAAHYGVDDADQRVVWKYQQQVGPYGVRIKVEAMEANALLLTASEAATFAALVSKPPKPNPKLTAAMKRFKARPAVHSFRKGIAP
jgi:hypothetical protein